MQLKQTKITQELYSQREKIQQIIEPFWYRYERYNLSFCLLIFYSINHNEELNKQHIHITDEITRLNKDLTCIIFESMNINTALSAIEKKLSNLTDLFQKENQVYYASVVCSAQSESAEELINKSFMIMEYAYEYEQQNQILDFGVLPSKIYRFTTSG